MAREEAGGAAAATASRRPLVRLPVVHAQVGVGRCVRRLLRPAAQSKCDPASAAARSAKMRGQAANASHTTTTTTTITHHPTTTTTTTTTTPPPPHPTTTTTTPTTPIPAQHDRAQGEDADVHHRRIPLLQLLPLLPLLLLLLLLLPLLLLLLLLLFLRSTTAPKAKTQMYTTDATSAPACFE